MGLLFFLRACGVHLQREKSRFCPCLCLLSSVPIFAGLAVSACLYIRKKKRPFVWSFPLWVLWLLFSPIEQIKTLQAGCRFGLLLLSCLCLSAFLLPWGLQYSKDLPYRLLRSLCDSDKRLSVSLFLPPMLKACGPEIEILTEADN